LSNGGSTVRLLSSSGLIDTLSYPQLSEGISYGRDILTNDTKIFCVPTERSANIEMPVGLSIAVQSGDLQGTEDVTVNLTSIANYPTALNGAACAWDYPDGYKPETCNPPSHTLSSSGVHLITLQARLACGREERATVTVRIDPEVRLQKTVAESAPTISDASDVILSAAMPHGLSRGDGWVSLRNTGNAPVDLLSFSLHGGLIPNDHYIFPSLQLLPREERRFSLELLRLDLPATGEVILRNPLGDFLSVLSWDDSDDQTIIRPPVHPLGFVQVQVLRVLDGDTVDVALLDTNDPDLPASALHRWRVQELEDSPALRVRLIGIDAPELFEENGEISDIGLQALNYSLGLIDNKKIELQFDAMLWDEYERVLAYARLPESEETLQSVLLKSGHASAERGFDHPSLDEFIALEADAKSKKYGIWAKAETPKEFLSTSMVFSSKSFSSFARSSAHSSSRSSSSKVPSSQPTLTKKAPASAAGWMKVKWVGATSSIADIPMTRLESGSLLASLNLTGLENTIAPKPHVQISYQRMPVFLIITSALFILILAGIWLYPLREILKRMPLSRH
jgi:endonuclease YncB( thermonuclease family)